MSSSLPPHGTHVYINNRFRTNYLEDNAYNFDGPQFSSLITDDGYFLAQVKSVYTENYVNTVEQGINDVFVVLINGVISTTIIEPGVYTINSLLDVMDTIDASMNWTYNIDERRVTLAIDNTKVITFVDPDSMINLGFTAKTQKAYKRFLFMLGWVPVAQSNGDYTNTVVEGPNPVNLNTTGVFNINVYDSLEILTNDSNGAQTLIQVPNLAPFGGKIFYEPPNPPTVRIEPSGLQTWSFYVTDEWGERVKVPGNTPLIIHMVLFHQLQ